MIDEEETRQRYDHFRGLQIRARERQVAIRTEQSVITETYDFLADNDYCPTCEQPITPEHKASHNERIQPILERLERESADIALDIQTIDSETAGCELTWRGVVRKNQEITSTKTLLQRQMADKQSAMDRLEREALRLNAETNPFAAEAARVGEEYTRLCTLLDQLKVAETETVNRLAARDFWRQGFRRVRLFCLEKVLAELVLETRNSLLALGLVGWLIDFKTATETRSGTLKLGVQVDIRSPQASRKFEMMSGGESQRARLAVSLGLANLIQRWAGARFDLEVFDEPTAWLSVQGVEDLLESLHIRAETNNRSIWVCDHRVLDYAFSEVLQIDKDDTGSRVAKG
jgi:DNA repair exonuclease SbcCD ATPase subunit